MKIVKKTIKAILRDIFNIEVNPITKCSPSAAQLVASLRKFDIDLVLDVGANRGQFASEIRQAGYLGRIVSFEPLSHAHVELQQSCAADATWDAYPRCALGEHSGEVEINVAGNSFSSSIFPMLESHLEAAPESAYLGKELVPIKTLDDVARLYVEGARSPFLKIDTQGYEWAVLEGAQETLPKIQGLLVELSLVPLYDGQHLWMDVIERLEAAGFILWAFQPEFSDPASGRTLQVDGIFYRNPGALSVTLCK